MSLSGQLGDGGAAKEGGGPLAHARVIARGRVQGVFYRDTVRRAACERGISGSAVNEPDGTVLMLFEGRRADVEAVIEVARRGPSAARVDELSVEWLAPAGLDGFRTG